MGKLGILIIQEILAILNIIAGLFIFQLGWEILIVNSENQLITQGSAVLTALGLSMVFFGLNLIYTYHRDYKSNEDITKIQAQLNRIESKINFLIINSQLTLPESQIAIAQPSWFTTEKFAFFVVALILFILGGFSISGGNYLLASALLSIALILEIIAAQ